MSIVQSSYLKKSAKAAASTDSAHSAQEASNRRQPAKRIAACDGPEARRNARSRGQYGVKLRERIRLLLLEHRVISLQLRLLERALLLSSRHLRAEASELRLQLLPRQSGHCVGSARLNSGGLKLALEVGCVCRLLARRLCLHRLLLKLCLS
jgi:hypothetical protein